jgi:polar amino acid transport system permease protein
MFLHMLIFNPAFNWQLVFQAMNQSPVIEGFWKGTILVTILAMIFGVALGVVLAVMRLSDNPYSRECRRSTPGSSAPSRATCC